jgi:hypothetical protein
MCNATGEDYAPDAVNWFINGHIVNHRTMSRVRIYNEVDSFKRTALHIRNIVVPLLTKSFPDIITSKKGNICLNIKYQ